MFYMLDQDFTFMLPRKLLRIKKVTVIKKKNGNFIEHCNIIKKHERETDHLYRKDIPDLFETNDTVQIIKNSSIQNALIIVNML